MEELIKSTFIKMIKLPRVGKRMLMVGADVILLLFSLWASFVFEFKNEWVTHLDDSYSLFFVSPLIAIPLFAYFGFYHAVFRYINTRYFTLLSVAISIYALLFTAVVSIFAQPEFAWTLFFHHWMLSLGLAFGIRWLGWMFIEWLMRKPNDQTRVIIYGAGEAGAELVNSLVKTRQYLPFAFIDDKEELRGNEMLGLKIYSPLKLQELIRKYDIQEVLVAIPSASKKRLHDVIEFLDRYPVKVKTVPHLWDIISGKLSVSDIREVEIEDLLGRDAVMPDWALMKKCISGKSVLVTGAGGSIGSQLASQIVALDPVKLICFEISEPALYEVEKELRRLCYTNGYDVEIVPILGSVLDEAMLRNVLKAFKVETIYHAAAYKHVPIVELNPIVGVYNNLFGTWRTACAALEVNVETFILISSDKAVRPTNVMGASKRLAEMAVQGMAELVDSPRFNIVRFGNVLGSSGSIVPLIKEQIRHGGPVTVTHPDVIRYFMTIPEAAQLVIQAGSLGNQGEVFVLDMGEPVKIMDLAKKMVSLSGLHIRDEQRPDGDIEIAITGLRPGEKLYEELLIGGDNIEKTKHSRILRAKEENISWPQLTALLSKIEQCCNSGDVEALRELLLANVSGYKPQCEIKDPVWLALSETEEALAMSE